MESVSELEKYQLNREQIYFKLISFTIIVTLYELLFSDRTSTLLCTFLFYHVTSIFFVSPTKISYTFLVTVYKVHIQPIIIFI